MDSTAAATHLVRMVRRIRDRGVAVSMAQTRDLVEALAVLSLDPADDAHYAARSILASSPADYPAIDEEWQTFLKELVGSVHPQPEISGLAVPADDKMVEIGS